MRRFAIALLCVLSSAGALGVWFAWPRERTMQLEAAATDLDGWERLAQTYHRPLPLGKDLVIVKVPVPTNPRRTTWSVTVNGTAP